MRFQDEAPVYGEMNQANGANLCSSVYATTSTIASPIIFTEVESQNDVYAKS